MSILFLKEVDPVEMFVQAVLSFRGGLHKSLISLGGDPFSGRQQCDTAKCTVSISTGSSPFQKANKGKKM